MSLTPEKRTALETALKSIKKNYRGQTNFFPEYHFEPVERIPLLFPQVNEALGGGVPRGKIIEIFGPESAGKSLFCALVVAEFQKAGLTCVWMDLERSFDPEFYSKQGVNPSEILLSTPDTAEDAINIMTTLASSGAVDLIIGDSVAAMITEEQLNKEAGEATMASLARILSPGLAKLVPICDDSKCTIFLINQIREKVGVMMGNPEETPGGRALKFYSSIRIDLRRKSQSEIKDAYGKDVIGHSIVLKTKKNKTAPPQRSCEYTIYYGGVNSTPELKIGHALEEAEQLGVIVKDKQTYVFTVGEGMVIRGVRRTFVDQLAANEDMMDEYFLRIEEARKQAEVK